MRYRQGRFTGYLRVIFAGSVFGPALGARSAELFPTSIHARVAGGMSVAGVAGAVGGLALVGVLATSRHSFWTAAAVIALPVLAVCPLYAWRSKTRGLELEESVGD